MKRVLSGIKSSGDVTLGNYLGAMKRWARQQGQYENFYFIPDLHVLNVRAFQESPQELTRLTKESLAWLVASGVSPEKSTIYLQSSISAHSELSWILENFVYMGELSRMVQYKDKSDGAGDDSIPAALFTYPVLMAADILLYEADEVPVGDDQQQHVELARVIARRFNNLYGETFKVPKGRVSEVAARIMNLQNPHNKMSKSDTDNSGNILLGDDQDVIHRKIMRAVTDSDNEIYYDRAEKPGISNLLEIYAGTTEKEITETEAEFKDSSYKELKERVAEKVVDEVEPLQKKYKNLIQDEDRLKQILLEGNSRARSIAQNKLQQVRKAIGLYDV